MPASIPCTLYTDAPAEVVRRPAKQRDGAVSKLGPVNTMADVARLGDVPVGEPGGHMGPFRRRMAGETGGRGRRRQRPTLVRTGHI